MPAARISKVGGVIYFTFQVATGRGKRLGNASSGAPGDLLRWRFSFSSAQPAAVNVEDGAVQIIGVGRGQKNAAAGDVFRISPAAFRDSFQNRPVTNGILAQRPGVFRGDVTGGEGVDVDAFARPFVRQRLGDAGQAVFAGCVSRHQDAALKGQQRGNVNNFQSRVRRRLR